MNQSKLSSIAYIPPNGQQEIIIDEKNANKLSPISLSILDSVLSKKVTIIFSQGPLNLSPIISCIFALQEQKDVLIGMPKRKFTETFGENTKTYLSLLYRKKIGSISSNHFYFYDDALWCKGAIDDETNELTEIDITTRPKYGTRNHKKNYEHAVHKKLERGEFQKTPKIVSIPIDDLVPDSIIGDKSIKFETEDYKLENFNPHLIIYESINERRYNFDNILKLIEKSITSDVKLVLHFSWPYLRGLASFLDKIKDNNNVNVLHLGKRLCMELHNYFDKPPSNILPLSLEGNSWDIYYSDKHSLNFDVILPSLNVKNNNLSLEDVVYWDWPFDSRTNDIKEHLKYEHIDKSEKNILRYPPIFDTFLPPFDIERRYYTENRGWTTGSISESFSEKANETTHAVSIFKGLCWDLDKCRDISYELRGLYTPSTITKKTLFQAFLIERFLNCIGDACNSNTTSNTSIIVANLYPYLATQSSFPKLIDYLVESLQETLRSIDFPKITAQNSTIYADFKQNDKRFTIFKNGRFEEKSIDKIKRIYSKINQKIDIQVSYNNDTFRITMGLNEPVRYLMFNWNNQEFAEKKYDAFILYNAMIKNNGSFNERKLSAIAFDKGYKDWLVNTEVICRTDKNNRTIANHETRVIYGELSKMQNLPRELIQDSDLLIPGPIPFYTVSDDEILISKGYDALLLPFKQILFFAYPGANFRLLLRQMKWNKDIISNDKNSLARRDLLFSIEHTNGEGKRFKLPDKLNLECTQEEIYEGDTPFDTAFRQGFLDDSESDEDEQDEIKTLKEIWDKARNKQSSQISTKLAHQKSLKDHIYFYVEYGTGIKETISFPIDTLIRKMYSGEYILVPVDELVEGDQIFYIQIEERESIENYLLRTLLNYDDLLLEDILAPLTALKILYETLKSIDARKAGDRGKMDKMDWLLPEQKDNLFALFSALLNKSKYTQEELNRIVLVSIWGEVSPDKLFKIFSVGNDKITQSKLYHLAVEMGLKTYKEASFKVLCSTAINDQKHYSFHDKNNLLAIGRLIGHSEIINNYEIINDKGVRIGTFLRQVGRCVKRVASRNSESFNEMDMAIGDKMKKCRIIKIGEC